MANESIPSGMHYCSKCQRTKQEKDFYKKKDGECLPLCKMCTILGINPKEPTTAYPLLKTLDIPYIPNEWAVLVERYTERGVPKTQSIVGRYISKMKLAQFKDYNFADTEKLIASWEDKVAMNEQVRQEQMQDYVAYMEEEQGVTVSKEDVEKIFGINEFTLTTQERTALRAKWMSTKDDLYQEEELIKLETFWVEMMSDFDVQTASHKNYLKLICKCALKTEQALDHGDADAFQKFSKQYDALMKSANFTAIQNKEATSGKFDAVGEIVRICEEQGGAIEPYEIDVPKDIVDITLRDMNNYTNYLVKTELNLGELIEGAISQLLLMAEQQNQEDEDLDISDEDYDLFNEKFEDDEDLEEEDWGYLEEAEKDGTE